MAWHPSDAKDNASLISTSSQAPFKNICAISPVFAIIATVIFEADGESNSKREGSIKGQVWVQRVEQAMRVSSCWIPAKQRETLAAG